MNRRELIRRGPMALIGAVAAAAGVKAQLKDKPQPVIASLSVPMNDPAIIRELLAHNTAIVMPPLRPMSREEIQMRIDEAYG